MSIQKNIKFGASPLQNPLDPFTLQMKEGDLVVGQCHWPLSQMPHQHSQFLVPLVGPTLQILLTTVSTTTWIPLLLAHPTPILCTSSWATLIHPWGYPQIAYPFVNVSRCTQPSHHLMYLMGLCCPTLSSTNTPLPWAHLTLSVSHSW